MTLILEHFDEVMLKSDACFLRNPIAELAWLTGTLFYDDDMVAVAITQMVLDLYRTFRQN